MRNILPGIFLQQLLELLWAFSTHFTAARFICCFILFYLFMKIQNNRHNFVIPPFLFLQFKLTVSFKNIIM